MSEQVPAIVEHPPLAPNATLPQIVLHEIAKGSVTPETVQKMLELQIQWEKREAEKEFFAAKARLKFPPIPRTKKSLNGYYAPMDEIQKIIDPILEAEGFSLTFTSGEPDPKERIPIIGKLAHKLGHFELGTVYQPISAVTKGMNANQALGSAMSYGERYCAQMMLNLRFIGMDDDAQSLSVITDGERMNVEDLIQECSLSEAQKSKFLEFLGAKSLGEIQRGAYVAAINYLTAMRRKLGEQPK